MKNDSDDYLSVNIEQNNVLFLLHVFISSVYYVFIKISTGLGCWYYSSKII